MQGERITDDSYLKSLPFLPIFPAAPDNINFRYSTYFSSNTSQYMRTPTSAPLSESAGPGYHLLRGKLQLPATNLY